jgi:hypothetical protein
LLYHIDVIKNSTQWLYRWRRADFSWSVSIPDCLVFHALSHQILIAFFSLKIKFKEDAKINVLRDGDILNGKEIIKFSRDRNENCLFFQRNQ